MTAIHCYSCGDNLPKPADLARHRLFFEYVQRACLEWELLRKEEHAARWDLRRAPQAGRRLALIDLDKASKRVRRIERTFFGMVFHEMMGRKPRKTR